MIDVPGNYSGKIVYDRSSTREILDIVLRQIMIIDILDKHDISRGEIHVVIAISGH
jgi:hypothetical protein